MNKAIAYKQHNVQYNHVDKNRGHTICIASLDDQGRKNINTVALEKATAEKRQKPYSRKYKPAGSIVNEISDAFNLLSQGRNTALNRIGCYIPLSL